MWEHYHYDLNGLPYSHMHTTYSFFFNKYDLMLVSGISQGLYCLAYYPNIRVQTLVQTQQAYLTPFSNIMTNLKFGNMQGIKGIYSGFSPYLVYWMGDAFTRFQLGFGYMSTLMVTLLSGVFYPFELQQIRMASATNSDLGMIQGPMKDVLTNYTNPKYWTGFTFSILRNYTFYSSITSSVILNSIIPFAISIPFTVAFDNLRRCMIAFKFDPTLISRPTYYEVYSHILSNYGSAGLMRGFFLYPHVYFLILALFLPPWKPYFII